MVSCSAILSTLPAYADWWELVKKEQYVPDIMREVVKAHKLFAGYYDQFSYMFYNADPAKVADNLYEFCKRNISYQEEGVEFQTSALPTGILHRGFGDCKHYALFTGGVLGSLNRLYNCCFDVEFYFVAYEGRKEPYHVFICVKDYEADCDIWLDPTPGSGGMPTLIIPKKV